MKGNSVFLKRGFTLVETVIAIGVLAVLLTGFMVVFAPAAAGIKRVISIQEADRLATTVEQELATLRTGDSEKTGFEKSFNLIKSCNTASDALLVYQYRGDLAKVRPDGTLEPMVNVQDKMPGEQYNVQTMVRRKSDSKFMEDLPAVEGNVYLVKCTQLVFDSAQGGLILGIPGQIKDPKGSSVASSADLYPEAVIGFSADFYTLPAKSESFFGTGFDKAFTNAKKPVFSRNLAVRR